MDSRSLPFSGLLSARILMLAKTYQRLADRSFRARFGLSLQQCHLINLVGSFSPLPFKRAGELSGLAKSHLSHLLSGLIKRGLVEKKADASDQRSVILNLTGRGRKLHFLIFEASRERNELWLAGLSATQRKTVAESIDLLSERILRLQPGRAPLTPNGMFADNADCAPCEIGEDSAMRKNVNHAPDVTLDAALARQLYERLGSMLAAGEEKESNEDG